MIQALSVSEPLKLILLESLSLRRLRKDLWTTGHKEYNHAKTPGPGGRCTTCKDEAPEHQCVRLLKVKFNPRGDLCGAVIVPYALDDPDSVLPKVTNKL
jgi:hypothetical protein